MGVVGLRRRITLLVAGVVAVCLLAGFVAVYRGTSHGLTQTTDHGLREDVANLRAGVIAASPGEVTRRARSYLERQPFRPTTHVVFVDTEGQPVVTNEPELLDTTRNDRDDRPAERRQETRDARAVLTAAPGFSRLSLPGVGPVRLIVDTAVVGGRLVRFGVAEPTQPITRAEDTVSHAFLLAGILGMVAALIGGLFVASRISAPLRRMARVAARVDAGDLTPRMELDGPRDEIRVLAHSFDQMLERLQDAFARQTAFVGNASHELRTPLTIIRGQLEVLEMSHETDPTETRRVHHLVLGEIDHMSRLVDDLLLLTHAEDDGFVRTRAIDVPAFLDDLCAALRPTADRQLDLAPVAPLRIQADPDRLTQALRNLIANAFAHTEPAGHVDLSVQERGDRIRFVVDDDGSGVPPADRERIFDRFARLDTARGRTTGGAGLGLSIVRAIARAHHGDVRIEDSPSGGARFVLELPRGAASAQASRSDTSPLTRAAI
jgi:two-component system, OmpR family, sensor kinase